MTVLVFASALFAAVVVLAALETAGWAFLVGRYKRRRSDFTVLVLSQPPVPRVETDDEWLDAWVSVEDIEQESYDRDFYSIPLVVDDLRNAR